jgi:hypothetical protein
MENQTEGKATATNDKLLSQEQELNSNKTEDITKPYRTGFTWMSSSTSY